MVRTFDIRSEQNDAKLCAEIKPLLFRMLKIAIQIEWRIF